MENTTKKRKWVTPEIFGEAIKETEAKSPSLSEGGASTGPS